MHPTGELVEARPEPRPAAAPGRRAGVWTPAQRAVVALAAAVGVVLRWWGLGSSGLSFDEAFTAEYARLPLSALPGALRATDSHPPLDYVLRHWLVGAHDEWLLRAPSALFSTLALVLVVAWMRRRAWFGVGVVALTAVSPFLVLYGRQARMYALLTLLGVAVAMVAERWWTGDRRPRVVVAVGALVAVACLDHAGGLFLAAGVFCLPGVRRDRDAWWWRAAPVAGVLVWALVWAPSFLDQTAQGSSSWVPLTSPASVASTLGGLASFVTGAEWLVAALLVGGTVCLRAVDRTLARLVVCLFGVPLALLVVAGLHFHVLLPRTLGGAAWSAPVALAALVTWLWQRRAALGIAAAVLLVAVTARSLVRAVTYDEGASAAVDRAVAAVEPGDGLLVHPHWWWPLAVWNGAEGDRFGAAPPTALQDAEGWYWARPGALPTGRTWVLRPSSYGFDTSRWLACGSVDLGEGWIVECVTTGGP